MAYPKDTMVLARENKTRTKVICGHELSNGKLCNGDVADIVVSRVNGYSFRKIVFPLGWDEQPPGSGVWRMTRNAQRKSARSHVGLWRSMPFAGVSAKGRLYLARRSPRSYPAWTHCSVSAFHWQKLDASLLDVATWEEVVSAFHWQSDVVTVESYSTRPRPTHCGGRRNL
jgi:hypothetical protein